MKKENEMSNNQEQITAELDGLNDRCREALRAVGIGEPGGSRYGRKLDYRVQPSCENPDEEGSKRFASFCIHQPFLIFRIEPEQVRALANELTEIANGFDGWEGERHATPSKPDTHAIHAG